MVRCDPDRRKQTTDDTTTEMNPADSSLKLIIEKVMDMVCVSRVIATMRYQFFLILTHTPSLSIFEYIDLPNVYNQCQL
jgi:hypothetical protein